MTEVVNISFETNDLSQFTSTSGDGLSVATAAAMGKTNYGMNVNINDTTSTYGVKNVTVNHSGIVRVRVYIDPNSLTMANSDEFAFLRLINNATATFANMYLGFTTTGNLYRCRCSAILDSAAESYTARPNFSGTNDGPHMIEMNITKSSGADDGILNWWIDGEAQSGLTGLDNDTWFADFTTLRVGAATGIDAGTTGDFYLDELIVNDDGGLIGPVPGLAFGVALPTTANESAVSWDSNNGAAIGWSNGAGAAVTVSGDASWGKMELDIGEEGRSQVYDLGAVYTYTFTITENRYGTGSGTATLQYRTDTSAFLQDDVGPAWTTYTVPFAVSCRYVQIREIKSS